MNDDQKEMTQGKEKNTSKTTLSKDVATVRGGVRRSLPKSGRRRRAALAVIMAAAVSSSSPSSASTSAPGLTGVRTRGAIHSCFIPTPTATFPEKGAVNSVINGRSGEKSYELSSDRSPSSSVRLASRGGVQTRRPYRTTTEEDGEHDISSPMKPTPAAAVAPVDPMEVYRQPPPTSANGGSSSPLSDMRDMISHGMNGRFMFFASETKEESSSKSEIDRGGGERATVSMQPTLMPPWLDIDSSNGPTPVMIREKMSKLRSIMSSKSHLSESEIQMVVSAMLSACGSDTHKLSGAIDFISILVEYMEMGDSALIASAFHYSSCVTVREMEAEAKRHGNKEQKQTGTQRRDPRGISNMRHNGFQEDPDIAYLCPLARSDFQQYGVESVRIALGAARLKGTEAVAAKAVSSFPSGRTSRDDLENLQSLLLSVNAHGDWRALAIRSGACLYRLRGLENYRARVHPTLNHPTQDEVRVAREALHIYAALAHRLGMHRLKSELEDTAFRVLYRRQHLAVMGLLYHRRDGTPTNRRGVPIVEKTFPSQGSRGGRGEDEGSVCDGMRSVLADITSQVKRILHEDETLMEHVSSLSVSARVKEPYSLWRKMLRIRSRDAQSGKKMKIRPLSVLDVPDAIALRVVLQARKLSADESDEMTSSRERSLCYYVHQLCTTHFHRTSFFSSDSDTQEGNRFKDYIMYPKRNGYQSLHFSARTRWHGEYWPFEVQIRSADMHRVAEYGLAAHWEYKIQNFKGGEKKGGDGSRGAGTTSRSGISSYLKRYLKGIEESNKSAAVRGMPQDHRGRRLTTDSLASLGYGSLAAEERPNTGETKGGNSEETSLLYSLFSPLSPSEASPQDGNGFERRIKTERIRARAERLAPYIEALSTARTDLARERVFVFLKILSSRNSSMDSGDVSFDDGSVSGSIISLPAGACVLDALREQERKAGTDLKLFRRPKRLVGVDEKAVVTLRNGVLTSITQRLESGDVLTLCIPEDDH